MWAKVHSLSFSVQHWSGNQRQHLHSLDISDSSSVDLIINASFLSLSLSRLCPHRILCDLPLFLSHSPDNLPTDHFSLVWLFYGYSHSLTLIISVTFDCVLLSCCCCCCCPPALFFDDWCDLSDLRWLSLSLSLRSCSPFFSHLFLPSCFLSLSLSSPQLCGLSTP